MRCYFSSIKKKGEKHGWEVKPTWQDRVDSDNRNAGAKVLCLTAWLLSYIQGHEIHNYFCDFATPAVLVGSATST